jgi:hypothetical protein
MTRIRGSNKRQRPTAERTSIDVDDAVTYTLDPFRLL